MANQVCSNCNYSHYFPYPQNKIQCQCGNTVSLSSQLSTIEQNEIDVHDIYEMSDKDNFTNDESAENSTTSSTATEQKTKTYPSLIFLSRVAKFIAWVGVFSSLIIGVFYIITLNRPSIMEILFPVLGIVLITFIHFVFWRAISEILILFVDIAKDVRDIRLKK